MQVQGQPELNSDFQAYHSDAVVLCFKELKQKMYSLVDKYAHISLVIHFIWK